MAGYKKTTEGNVLTGHVILSDFEHDDPERKYTEKNVYNKTTQKYEAKRTYYYTTAYHRPAYVTLKYGDEVLYEEIIEPSITPIVLRSDKSPNIKNLEKRSVKNPMLLVKEFINSRYGYSQVSRNLTVRWIKNKKGNYDDLESAKDKALASYEDFNGGKNSAELMEAIAIWKMAMNESSLEDKKVTTILLLNLIEASLIIQNPMDAQTYMKTLKTIKLSYVN